MPDSLHRTLANGNLLDASDLLQEALEKDHPAAQICDWFITFHSLYCFTDCERLAAALLNAPDQTPSHLLPCARLLFQSGRYQLAAKLTKRAHQLDPQNTNTLAMLASAIERSGQPERARKHLAQALKLEPSHARSIRLLAHLDCLAGNLDQARALLESNLAQYPSPEDWRLRYELATILDRQKDHRLAMTTLTQAKNQITPSVPSQEATQLTTRQWEITQQLTTSRLKTWHRLSPCLTPPLNICLLAGFPRSGTTLLENILTSHPDTIGTGESGILFKLFEAPIILAASSAEEALAELDDFLPDELSAGRADYLRCTSEQLGEAMNKRLIIEKDPLLTSSFAIPLRLFPDSKIIIPIRDPRDVVISYFFTIVPLAANSASAISLEQTCQFYADTMRHWLLLKERLPSSQWMESRYEDLLSDPESQTKKLARFLQIPWSPSMLQHHNNSQNKLVTTPTYHDVSKPLYTRALARWKNYEAELAPHLHHLRPYLEALGYAQ